MTGIFSATSTGWRPDSELQLGVSTESAIARDADAIGRRIATLKGELAALRQQQRAAQLEALFTGIARTVGVNVVFSAHELWQHRTVSVELCNVFTALDISSCQQLGKRLRRLAGQGLTRVGRDHFGAIWILYPH
jgi:hypothetical protein